MQYEVKALRGNDGLTALLLDAADANDARAQAMAQGYTVIAARAMQQWPVLQWWRRAEFPLMLFSQELTALLEAGLPLLEALETLTEKEELPHIRKTLARTISCISEGHTLSYAMEQSPGDFPALYVATVRSSERTGGLAQALARYVEYQSQMEGVKRRVVSSLIYPVILAAVGMLVVVFLLVFVVPRFSHIYEDMGSELPLMSRLMMHWGQFLNSHWQLVLVLAVAVFWAFLYAAGKPACRLWVERRLWQIPALGKRLHLYQTTRFYRSLGMLLRGGMPVMTALHLASGLLQASTRERLALASNSIREGGAISHAMKEHGLATPLAFRLLRVGECSGRMGEMMERIAAFYEEETGRWIERFTRMFEPLLMAFIGLVIGAIVVLMYFPIFELAGSIK